MKKLLHNIKYWYLYRIKQPLWCRFFHNKDRCYPRVDIADDIECHKHWHCNKCTPCGEDVFEYLELYFGSKK